MNQANNNAGQDSRQLRPELGAGREATQPWAADPPSSTLSAQAWQAIAETLALPARQLEIVQGAYDGLERDAIAERLNISKDTVHSHLERIYRKLGVANRADLLVRIHLVDRWLWSNARK